MKKLLLTLGLLLGLTSLASAQCVGVGGVNTVPQVGVACLSEPTVNTYAATGIGIVAATSPTDVACISGSATQVIRVQRILLSATITTQVIVPVVILKRATADTGGTAAVTTALPAPNKFDSASPAATATTIAYTANPTINDTSPGLLAAGLLIMAKADGTNGAVAPMTAFDFSEGNTSMKPILRGVAQQICVNLNATAATMTGNLINAAFHWTEAIN